MDSTLLRRCQAGDEEAFEALFHKHKNLVYKTAYLMLGNGNEAEDALQEVFVKVYRSLATFQPSKGAFTTWLHRITVNHCLNRRRKRRLSVLSLDEIPPASVSDHSLAPDERLGEEEEVQQALSQLSEKQRAVVILRYFWNLSYAEIAQTLGIPLGTVRSRLNLALKTLHRELIRTMKDAPAIGTFRSEEVAR